MGSFAGRKTAGRLFGGMEMGALHNALQCAQTVSVPPEGA